MQKNPFWFPTLQWKQFYHLKYSSLLVLKKFQIKQDIKMFIWMDVLYLPEYLPSKYFTDK